MSIKNKNNSKNWANTAGYFPHTQPGFMCGSVEQDQWLSIKIPHSYLEQELIRTVNAGRSEGQCVPAAL